ncbi:hypothetical protein TYRP_017343 [Tyrophagus putrescentiae]|nr:hypothetical protein TYRP_017343 [Tyrophagus putrescentiae]
MAPENAQPESCFAANAGTSSTQQSFCRRPRAVSFISFLFFFLFNSANGKQILQCTKGEQSSSRH